MGTDDLDFDDIASQHHPSHFGMGRQDMEMMMDRQFAMTHGIFQTPQVGSLFECMGKPKELIYQPLSIQDSAIRQEIADSLPSREEGDD
jgi:hypothetical protein